MDLVLQEMAEDYWAEGCRLERVRCKAGKEAAIALKEGEVQCSGLN